MVRGLYTAATGMMVQRNKMNVLTNNLVNAETAGYKKDTLLTSSFDQVLLQRVNDPNVSAYGSREVGAYSYGTHIDELFTSFTEGSLENTQTPTDLAIQGDGFFAIETPEGERYTRAGNFTVNSEGYLVTQDGNYVLGQNGRLLVGSREFAVAEDGTVTDGPAAGQQLRVVTFQDNGVLRKEGNNLYYAYDGAAPVEAAGVSVRQGVLESSNVELADEMTDMITVYRKYEASQKMVSMTDDSLGLAVNLGKVGG